LAIDEALLIKQLKDPATQEAAFRTLISDYKQRLYWHIRRIVFSHDDADDVLQNTFIKIFRSIHSFKEDSKLYTWFYRIATNESITFINARAKNRHLDVQDYQHQLVGGLQHDVLFNGDKIQEKLQEAIVTLPQKQQLVFNMKYFQEMKYHEISEILDTSVGALKASYFHAVKKIEKYIRACDLNLS
jgi:RNA polymerase sigma-70 factor (ECF subfamily)